MYDPVAEKAAVESRARDGTRLSDGNVDRSARPTSLYLLAGRS